MDRRWLALPLHPFLFGILALASLLSFNMGQFLFKEVFRPTVLVVAVTAVALVLTRWASGDLSLSALLVSVGSVLFFGYGDLFGLILVGLHFVGRSLSANWEGAALALVAHLILFSSMLAILAAVYRLLVRKPDWWELAGMVMNCVVVVALVFPVYRIVTAFRHSPEDTTPTLVETWPAAEQGSSTHDQPDIYYLLLDGYARGDVLDEIYGMNNDDFLASLREMGFTVADESRSNYSQTVLSQASTLNMAFVQDLVEGTDPDADHIETTGTLMPLVRDSQVRQFLHSLGYTFVAFSSGYGPTEMPGADVYLEPDFGGINTFESLVVRTSVLSLVEDAASALRLPISYSGYSAHRERVRFVLDTLPEIAGMEGPKFVYVHLLVPHPPFVFRRDGAETEPRYKYTLGDASDFPLDKKGYIEGYREHVLYINDQLLKVLPAISERSAASPVIVLQGDHGPGSTLDWGSPTERGVWERMAILNAYRIPGSSSQVIYPSITPVNTFRLLFNELFGMELALLPDHAYYSGTAHPFAFERIR